MIRFCSISLAVACLLGSFSANPLAASGLSEDVGSPPVITLPVEGDNYECNESVNYCWQLPEGVAAEDVSGYELQFSNTETPDGPWDAVRFFTSTCWYYAAGHQEIYEALYWRVRIVYDNADRSPWAISYHRVGTYSIIGSPPAIILPAENAEYETNEPVDYCWNLPEGVAAEDVSGYELQFSNTQTPDGPWDAVRFFTSTCWHYGAGHQEIYEALYWRVRIVYDNNDRSPWAISYHQVKAPDVSTDSASWGVLKKLSE